MTHSSRVVVTGVGAVTPLGIGADAYWEGLVAGRSGVRRVESLAELPVKIAGIVPDFDPTAYLPAKEARRMARFTQLAFAATHEAIAHSGLDLAAEDSTRIGVEMGCATGSVETVVSQYEVMRTDGPRRMMPTTIMSGLINMAACQIAMHYGLRGPGGAPTAACATGLYAIGDAMRRIQRGEADVMVAGGTESFLHPLAVAGFWRLQALSARNDDPEAASRPFDRDRDGTVMAEGAALLILESEAHARARGATILGELIGFGQTMDAYHMIAPDEQGDGAARAMHLAFREANLSPDRVDWISAHATATPLNDVAETRAIKRVFGDAAYRIPISGLKGATGHMLGAAGSSSAIACLAALRDNCIPPTRNLEHPDLPDCDLDYVAGAARDHRVDIALANAFGFGGQNAALLVRRYA